MTDRRSILLLCSTERNEGGNVAAHVAALTRMSRHDVRPFNPVDRPDAAALLDLNEFDVVVIHYTIAVTIERYLPNVLREKIARFQGLKVQFIQDEYRWIDAVTARVRELEIDLLYTLVPEAEVAKIYGSRLPEVKITPTLAGFVPDELVDRVTLPLAERPIDVGYRGRTVPYWLGRLAYEKWAIGVEFAASAERFGLKCDIAVGEDDRIYGERWNRFLASCRATLGTESGASIADFDGSVEAAVKDYLVRHADALFEESRAQRAGAARGERPDQRHLAAPVRSRGAPDCDGPPSRRVLARGGALDPLHTSGEGLLEHRRGRRTHPRPSVPRRADGTHICRPRRIRPLLAPPLRVRVRRRDREAVFSPERRDEARVPARTPPRPRHRSFATAPLSGGKSSLAVGADFGLVARPCRSAARQIAGKDS